MNYKQELSSVERCKKNKWKKTTILEQEDEQHFKVWKITGFGEPFETTGEVIMPLHNGNWRKLTDW